MKLYISNVSYNLWFATELFKFYNYNELNASLWCICIACYIELFDINFYYNLSRTIPVLFPYR